MSTLAILWLWLASFAADNLWRIVLPLADRAMARASYALAWGALAVLLAFAARRPWSGRPFAMTAGCIGIIAAGAAGAVLRDEIAVYVGGLFLLRLAALAMCFALMERAASRYAFAAAVGLAAGHALSLGSFLIARIGPVVFPDAGSQLAMRYGTWAGTVEGMGCILAMALAMAWAATGPASGATGPRR